MQHRLRQPWLLAATLVAAMLLIATVTPLHAGSALTQHGKKRGDIFTLSFRLQDCTFVTEDGSSPGNPFFPLVPGHQLVLENEEEGERNEITTCLDDGSNCSKLDGTPVPGVFTIALDGIETRVVEERETVDGELVEISHNLFARCRENGSVFYFGEMVQEIEDGHVVGGGGAWQAGVGTAMPGVIMPGIYLLGSRYFQEVAPGVALDRAEHTRMNLEIEVDLAGAGETTLEGCVEAVESSPLDRKGSSSVKQYCPGVGLVFDSGSELVDKNF